MPRRNQVVDSPEQNGATDQQVPAPMPAMAPAPAPVAAIPIMAPPPMAAPHSARAQQSETIERDEQLRARRAALKALPKGVPITDVTIIIGLKTKAGRQEIIHDIGHEFRITQANHSVEEKVRPVTEQGQFLGMEPTGEYLLNLKVKYYAD